MRHCEVGIGLPSNCECANESNYYELWWYTKNET